MDSSTEPLDSLRAFRGSFYRCFGRRADALFELTDALLTAGAVSSPVHLSLARRTEDYGSVRVRAWSRLHPKTRRIGERYGCEKAPVARGTVVLVKVGRLPRETREPKKLWLWFSGDGEPDLRLLWLAYVRRFDLEHAIRFWKQTLGWTAPRVRHPEQADRWTWLVLAAYAQLRLARGVVADRRLPWERPRRH